MRSRTSAAFVQTTLDAAIVPETWGAQISRVCYGFLCNAKRSFGFTNLKALLTLALGGLVSTTVSASAHFAGTCRLATCGLAV